MRHHTSQLRLCIRGLDGPEIYKDRPAWQREGIDLRNIGHVEVVGPLVAGSVCHEFFSEVLNIAGDWARIRQHRHLLVDLLFSFIPELDLLLGREAVLTRRQM